MVNDVVYRTGITPEGKLLVGGIFKMKDQEGFPLDMSYEFCKEHNLEIDLAELFAEAWLNDCLKFDSVITELKMLYPPEQIDEALSKFKQWGASILNQFPEFKNEINPVDAACRKILEIKRYESKRK